MTSDFDGTWKKFSKTIKCRAVIKKSHHAVLLVGWGWWDGWWWGRCGGVDGCGVGGEWWWCGGWGD